MPPTQTIQLSKSHYVEGVLCRKRLWLKFHARHLAAPPSTAQKRTLEEGTLVGKIAREALFPGGLLITQIGASAVKETAAALRKNPAAIFEATFLHRNVLVMADILANNFDGTWDLIEVKASTRLKPEYFHDVAVQRYVIESAGLTLRRQRLVHINNREPLRPDHSNLFCDHDITQEVGARLADVPVRIRYFLELIAQAREPQVTLGNRCQKPHPCPFHDHCWRHVPEPSVFSIPRLKGAEKSKLAAKGILSIHDLPPDYPLSMAQRNAVNLICKRQEEVDIPAIRDRLRTLQYPIHFFDFETDSSAVPSLPGLKPYQQVPFQYSCHILHADGQLKHREYLHTTQSDPRWPLLQNLLQHIGSVGSIVVYNAQFERGVLRKMIEWAPEQADALQSIIDRLWDQLEIFRRHYRSYRFQGSNSIKKVLPVVAPHLSYANLSVCRGDDAQAVWSQMSQAPDSPEKQRMIDDLRAYCKLDTFAMVEIHHHLVRLTLTE